MQNKITIVIPNYNGCAYLQRLLSSLETQTYKAFETIVVDNGSSDDSVHVTSRSFPDVTMVPLRQNHGFAAAVNKGVSLAKTKYVILLNNDTVAPRHFTENLLEAIEASEKNCFCVAAKMLYPWKRRGEKIKIDNAGDFYTLLGWTFSRGKNKDGRRKRYDSHIFSACAGAAIYKKSVLEELGGFDEAHFAYLEDVDIGYAARLLGYDSRYCDTAYVMHIGSATMGGRYTGFKAYLTARNNIFLLYKNMPNWQLLLNAPVLIAGTLIKYLFYKAKGFGGDYKKGVREGFLRRHMVARRNPKFVQALLLQRILIKNTFFHIKNLF